MGHGNQTQGYPGYYSYQTSRRPQTRQKANVWKGWQEEVTNLLRRLWNRRPWRPKREPSIWEQVFDKQYENFGPTSGIEWKEITLEQLHRSSPLGRRHELVTPPTIDDEVL